VVDEHGVTRHEFKSGAPNQLWLSDITEHWTGEGKLYLCAVKDVHSNRIVGYSIDSRMKSSLAVAALNNAAARRGDVAGCVVHTDRGSQIRGRCDGPPRVRVAGSRSPSAARRRPVLSAGGRPSPSPQPGG
jgi:transposase InsO family protein